MTTIAPLLVAASAAIILLLGLAHSYGLFGAVYGYLALAHKDCKPGVAAHVEHQVSSPLPSGGVNR
jgi:hypothetical protein